VTDARLAEIVASLALAAEAGPFHAGFPDLDVTRRAQTVFPCARLA
jgi:hypothetical protein